MKLSEAIRLGAMLHPQSFCKWRERNAAWEIVATCALGAASEAGYFDYLRMPAWGSRICPECQCAVSAQGCGAVIAHLNDDHRWTREAIADWVATFEPADQPSEVLPASDAVREDVASVTA